MQCRLWRSTPLPHLFKPTRSRGIFHIPNSLPEGLFCDWSSLRRAVYQVPSQLGSPTFLLRRSTAHLYLLCPLDSVGVAFVTFPNTSFSDPTSWPSFTMWTNPLYLGAALALVFFVAGRIVHRFKLRHNPSAPGPTIAKYTNWWYLWKINEGKFQYWNIDQHAKHGRYEAAASPSPPSPNLHTGQSPSTPLSFN